MKVFIGYAVYSEVTKKFVVLDTGSGGYPMESNSPSAGSMTFGGIWNSFQEAEKNLNPIFLPHKETYKVVSIYAES